MGYIRHRIVAVIGYDRERLELVRMSAAEIYGAFRDVRHPDGLESLVSLVVPGVMNSYASFFVGPDGSKEGWSSSDLADDAYAELVQYLRKRPDGLDGWVVVEGVGGDDHDPRIVDGNHEAGEDD